MTIKNNLTHREEFAAKVGLPGNANWGQICAKAGGEDLSRQGHVKKLGLNEDAPWSQIALAYVAK